MARTIQMGGSHGYVVYLLHDNRRHAGQPEMLDHPLPLGFTPHLGNHIIEITKLHGGLGQNLAIAACPCFNAAQVNS